MKSRISMFSGLIFVLWAAMLLLTVLLTRQVFVTKGKSPVYDTMIEAAETAQECFDAIKQYKLDHDIEIVEEDKLETGMLGEYLSSIVTTMGELSAKRTTVNPNWAAVIVGMFRRAGLRDGDQIVMVFSGSFPAMNLNAIAAAQAYGLKTCIMASVGASNFGATHEDFTFFDMVQYLVSQKIIDSSHNIDYVSLGGASDIGSDFQDEEKRAQIIKRIQDSNSYFIYESDYAKDIDLRISYIQKDAPSMKFLINVGGSLVGLGQGYNLFVTPGYVSPGYLNVSDGYQWGVRSKNCGLLQWALGQGVPVAHMLNITRLAADYGVPYDPDVKPVIGEGDMYYSENYDLALPAIMLCVSLVFMAFYCYHRLRYKTEERKDERNYILYRGR